MRNICAPTNTRYLTLQNYQKAYNTFLNPDSAEVKKLMRSEYYYRSEYQARHCFDNGGWACFETLTYDDANLPMMSDFFNLPEGAHDFSCFNLEHWKEFHDKLTSMLHDHGYGFGCYKFLMCTEYGGNDEYIWKGVKRIKTFRPHYHILFFIYNKNLKPWDFAYYVHECWNRGRTNYNNGKSFVDSKTVRNGDFNSFRGRCAYVVKYITKDADYQKKLNSRVDMMLAKMFAPKVVERLEGEAKEKFGRDVSGIETVDATEKIYKATLKQLYKENRSYYKKMRRDIKKRVDQFHRQSQHYGEYALQCLTQEDYDRIMEEGTLRYVDRKSPKLWKYIPLPMYYARKLFFEQQEADAPVVKPDGSTSKRLVWVPTEEGLKYIENHSYRSAERLAKRCGDFVLSLGTYFGQESQDIKLRIASLMQGRSWSEYAEYVTWYKDRLCDPACIDDIPTPKDIVLAPYMVDQTCKGDSRTYHELVADFRFPDTSKKYDSWDSAFREAYIIDDTWFDGRFYGFDTVYRLINGLMELSRYAKAQDVFVKQESLIKLYKGIGLHTENKI